MGKINASGKIMFKTHNKKRKYVNIGHFYINGIHSFLRRADARGSADIIYRI